jgi:hypothetical protein
LAGTNGSMWYNRTINASVTRKGEDTRRGGGGRMKGSERTWSLSCDSPGYKANDFADTRAAVTD